MRGARGMRYQTLRAAETDGELDDLKASSRRNASGSPPLDRESESRARTLALPFEDGGSRIVRREKAEIIDAGNLRVRAQEIRDQCGVLRRLVHAQGQSFHRPHDHPCGIRIQLSAQRAAQPLDRTDDLSRTDDAARHQIRMAADVLRERVHHQVGAMCEGPLKDRTEKGVVHQHGRAAARLPLADFLGYLAHQREIDQTVGGIRGRLGHHQTDAAAAFGGTGRGERGGFADGGPLVPARKAHRFDAEGGQRLLDQRLRAPIQRLAHQDHIAGAHIGPQRRRNGRHAARENGGGLALLPERKPILEHFQVGVVEA